MRIFMTSAALALMTLTTGCASTSDLPVTEISEETVNTLTSSDSFAAVDTRLASALAARPLKVFAVVDHGAGAKSIDQDIGQSKLYIFGNPKSGTPLMQVDRRVGLDLPMKMLVHETKAGEVEIVWQDINRIAPLQTLMTGDELISKIETTLASIAAEAAATQ